MALEASITAKLKVGDSTYDVNLDIPSTTPTKEAPYKFNIAQEQATGDPIPLLTAVIGDSSHFYVAVAPPQEVLSLTGDVVKELNIVANDGNFDPATGKFPTS